MRPSSSGNAHHKIGNASIVINKSRICAAFALHKDEERCVRRLLAVVSLLIGCAVVQDDARKVL